MGTHTYTNDALEAAFGEGFGDAQAVQGLGPIVSKCFDDATARFGAGLDALAFARDFGRRVGAWDAPVRRALEDIRAVEVYLCIACAHGHVSAQEEFERSYLLKASATLHRLELDNDTVEELAQQLRLRTLFPGEGRASLLDRFHGKGRLSSWLRVSITQMARRYLARRRVHDDLADALDRTGASDPELAFLREEYRPVFISGLRDAVAELDPKQRFVLAMNVVDRVPADTLARMYTVHRATVFRWLENTRMQILASTRAHVLASLQISEAEFEHLAGELLSQLDISLVRYLTTEPGRD